MTLLFSNKPILYLSVAMLTPSVQKPSSARQTDSTHCLYPHLQSDLVQLNAPEYDSNIDVQTDILPDIQPQVLSHAENTEEDPAPVTANSKEYSVLPQDSIRLESQSQPVPNCPEHS